MQYDTFEVFTCTADLFAFSLLIIKKIKTNIKNIKKSSGAVIGYLIQIFFISLHFLYDKELLLPSSMQSAFKRLSVLFVLDAGLFYKN